MAKRRLTNLLFVLLSTGLAVAQSDLAAKAVPDQDNGKDYAGRPVANPSVPQAAMPNPTQQQTVEQSVRDIHFAFDRSDITPEQRAVLQADAEWLKAHPNNFIVIEGDADERGGIAYNVALSDRRAIAVRDALLGMGVPANQIVFAEGWGKLYPVCNQSDEACWQQNRRAHFSLW
ncbi:MAG TPA: OmpA family protein [Terriglobales bacterium]|nr:OmpA family protein [Terriglobales bacterium]